MNLNTLSYFRVLGRLEHYGRAALELNIAQPALSRAIAQLENDLGANLFEHQGRNVRLTKWGKEFWKKVDTHLSDIELAAKEFKKRTENEIDLGFVFSAGVSIAPDLMKDFLLIPGNNDIHFNTTQGNSDELIQNLKKDICDISLTVMVENEPEIEFLPVHRQQIVVIVSTTHPLAKQDSVKLPDIFPYPLIYFRKKSSFRSYVDGLYEEFDAKPIIAYEVEEDNTIAGMVAANMGIAVVAYERPLTAFDIKILPITNKVYERYIYLAFIKNHLRTEAVDRFIKYAIAKCSK